MARLERGLQRRGASAFSSRRTSDTEKPVSRQHEMRYLGYYGYPSYWGGIGPWGKRPHPEHDADERAATAASMPRRIERNRAVDNAGFEAERDQNGDPHLRSCEEVMNYHIEASDGGIGHVENLLIDEETWAIRYMIVDTSNWWLGHQVLISPQWILRVHWSDNTVAIDATRQRLKEAPPYDPAVPLSRDQETDLYRHHGRPGYWNEQGSSPPDDRLSHRN